jgi:alcohol dehydrogenase (NADP+)
MITAKTGHFNIPAFGLGTWRAAPNVVKTCVLECLKMGYRHLDCAYIYENEQEIGEAISKSDVPRKDIFITSKLCIFINLIIQGNDSHAPSKVKTACLKTIKDLRCDYLDLYLMHWPLEKDETSGDTKLASSESIQETWKAMEILVDEGLVKAIGVSNFNIKKLEALLENCRIKPVNNQVLFSK